MNFDFDRRYIDADKQSFGLKLTSLRQPQIRGQVVRHIWKADKHSGFETYHFKYICYCGHAIQVSKILIEQLNLPSRLGFRPPISRLGFGPPNMISKRKQNFRLGINFRIQLYTKQSLFAI